MVKTKAKASKRKKSPNAHAREQFAALGRFVQAFELVGPTLFMDQSKQGLKDVTPDLERASGISPTKTGLVQGEGFARLKAVKA